MGTDEFIDGAMAWDSVPDRVVLQRIPATDGWTELRLACGHVVNVLTSLDTGAPNKCAECLHERLEVLKADRRARERGDTTGRAN